MLAIACALVGVFAFGFVGNLGHSSGEETGPVVPATTQPAVRPPPQPPAWRVDAAVRLDVIGVAGGPIDEALPRSVVRPQSMFDRNLVLSYYGHPGTAEMGIVGEYDPETLVALLAEHAERYDRQNGIQGVVPALHLIYAVAQSEPGGDERYLDRMDTATVMRYIELTQKHDMLLFLDIQVGRSSVQAEIARVLPFLRYPNVHLALDPEFAVSEGEVPGIDLGSMSAADINDAQAVLQGLVEDERLPPKALVVHQFHESMIRDGAAIQAFEGVDLVVDVDGFGPAATKKAIYQSFAARPYSQRPAIKLFFQQDPDLMTEQQVLSLVPKPALVIYQ